MKSLLKLVILILVALMPFATIATDLQTKGETIIPDFICIGDKDYSEKKCNEKCRGWPFYGKTSKCIWLAPLLWLIGKCACYKN